MQAPHAAGERPITIGELSDALESSAIARIARRLRVIGESALADSAVMEAAARGGAAVPTVQSRLLIGALVGIERERRKAVKPGSGGPPAFMAAEGLVALMAKKRTERENRYHDFLAHWDRVSSEGLADRFARVVSEATGLTVE